MKHLINSREKKTRTMMTPYDYFLPAAAGFAAAGFAAPPPFAPPFPASFAAPLLSPPVGNMKQKMLVSMISKNWAVNITSLHF